MYILICDSSGVLKDWQRYKQLESERRAEDEAERVALMKRLSLTCATESEERRMREKVAAEAENLEELDEVCQLDARRADNKHVNKLSSYYFTTKFSFDRCCPCLRRLFVYTNCFTFVRFTPTTIHF